MTVPARVLVVGGGSRLAARIRAVVPAARVVVRRAYGDAAETVVSDYREVPITSFTDIDHVVNCVGTLRGNAAKLAQVNVEIAVAVAAAARAAGCRHFVQISSLSVYGRAALIGAATPVAPVTGYGRSKAAADEALLALARPGFVVTILRVPALYGIGAAGKFGTLARVMRCIGFIAPNRPAARSLLHLDNAAAVVARLIAVPPEISRVVLAADHATFNLADFAVAVAEDARRPVRLVRLPRWVGDAIRRLAPGFHASVLAQSLIDPSAAITTTIALPVALPDGLAAMLAALTRTE